MRTTRALTVSPSMLCARRGGVCSGGMSAPGVVPAPGGCLLQGVCVCSRGGLLPRGGVVVPQYALRQTPPVNRITHACENITLPQLRCGR